MHYLPELYYLNHPGEFPFRYAFTVTARTVARWCTHFEARLIMPFRELPDGWERRGELPEDIEERDRFVADLVDWLFDNSACEELFYLMLDDEPLPKQNGFDEYKVAKFDHHDDTCCWVLNLSEEEFAQLQSSWVEHNLPDDLFYPEDLCVCEVRPPTTWLGKLLNLLFGYQCSVYATPKQRETLKRVEREEERA